MEFTGFRPEGMDLLIENRLMNSKEFYEAHKPQIKQLVFEPFYALIARMASEMCKIDPLFVVEPHRMVSRVRRDTRYTHDKSLYRDHVWLTFGRMKGDRFSARPAYYFEITPEYWGYGCGYYQAPPAEMQIIRELVLAEDRLFLDAFRAVNKCRKFTLYGERYKRVKYPDAPAKYQPWLQSKNIGVSCESQDFDALWDGSFVEGMLADLRAIAPLYRLFCAVKERAQGAETEAVR